VAKVASPVSNSSSKFPSMSTMSDSPDSQPDPDVPESSESDECGSVRGEAVKGGEGTMTLAMAATLCKIPGTGSSLPSALLLAAVGMLSSGGSVGHCPRAPVLAYADDKTSFGILSP